MSPVESARRDGEDGAQAPRSAPVPEVTVLLNAWQQGDRAAFDRLLPIVYDELRRLARGQLRRDAGSWTLQPTALVHEAYLRLAGADVPWQNREHFFAIAARVMRQILIDEARRRQADKRGGGLRPVELSAAYGEAAPEPSAESELLALDRALARLAELDERRARVVELRYFAGMTIEETGRALGRSHATIERDLKLARAWLAKELASELPGES